MAQSRPLFVYFRSFLIPITISIIQIEKSIFGVRGIRTRGRRMVDEDETTELWWHPRCKEIICAPDPPLFYSFVLNYFACVKLSTD